MHQVDDGRAMETKYDECFEMGVGKYRSEEGAMEANTYVLEVRSKSDDSRCSSQRKSVEVEDEQITC